VLAARTRNDSRDWAVKRRERTRHLIELGGLVVKSGLVDLAVDDRAVIFGLLVEAAATLRGENAEQQILLWRRRGQREFAQDRDGSAGAPPYGGAPNPVSRPGSR